jgi:fumarate reductase subunit C
MDGQSKRKSYQTDMSDAEWKKIECNILYRAFRLRMADDAT